MRSIAALCLLPLLLTAACGTLQQEKQSPLKTVTVFIWSEYIDPALVADFEQTTGYKVRLDVYESTEDMMAKLKQSGNQYDVVIASDHIIPVMVKLGLLQALQRNKIPNAGHVAPKFKNPPYDPENRYSLPYQWGTMGLMYRKDKLPNLDPSWGTVLDPTKQPGPVLLIDSMRDMLAGALLYSGYSVNTHKAEELRTAGERILKAKEGNVLGFEGGVGGVKKVLAGEALVAIVYNGDAIREMDPNTAFVIPREGTIIWVDAMTVPLHAPEAEGAHRFINFILDPQNGAKLSNFNRYASPNQASWPFIKAEDRNNPAIYPPEDQVQRMEYLADIGEDTRLYDEVWTGIKARP